MTEHMPGSWHVEPSGSPDCYVRDAQGHFIASVHLGSTSGPYTDNARLIAAAPDLLVALRGAVAMFKEMTNTGIVPSSDLRINAARAAIRKATAEVALAKQS